MQEARMPVVYLRGRLLNLYRCPHTLLLCNLLHPHYPHPSPVAIHICWLKKWITKNITSCYAFAMSVCKLIVSYREWTSQNWFADNHCIWWWNTAGWTQLQDSLITNAQWLQNSLNSNRNWLQNSVDSNTKIATNRTETNQKSKDRQRMLYCLSL